MLVSTKQLFASCYGKFAIAAINVFTMEQVLALFSAASKANAPIIVQTTPVARNYASPNLLLGMIKSAAVNYPKVTYAIHLDHGNEEHALNAIASGSYTSIMIDASHQSFDSNVAITKSIVSKAHKHNIAVEAELGVLSGVEDDITVDELNSRYTNPDQAFEFVKSTGCDSLAVAVGTSHGAYKFSGGKGLQFNILEKIQSRLPHFPLVLHGGSGIDAREIDRINSAGGKIEKGTKGVSETDIKKSIEFGVCKINVATDARIVWARVYREFLMNNPGAFDPIIPGKTYIQELEKMFIEKFELLDSANKTIKA